MKKNGFTLIELLAVIIILGILMLIAIPSVTSYINNSRKQSYVSSVKELIRGTTNLVNSGELEISNDPKTTYYIPCTCVNNENGEARSPYGNFDPAYVVVTYDESGYDYYFTGRDTSDVGVPSPVSSNVFDKEHILSNITSIDTSIGIKGTEQVVIYKDDCSGIKETKDVSKTVSGKNVSICKDVNGTIYWALQDTDSDGTIDKLVISEFEVDGVRKGSISGTASYTSSSQVPWIGTTSYDSSTNPLYNVSNVSIEGNVYPSSTAYWFYGLGYNVQSIHANISDIGMCHVTSTKYMLAYIGHESTTIDLGDINSWDTSSVTNMENMFNNYGFSLPNFILDLNNWDVSNVTSMAYMFYASGHQPNDYILHIEEWDTSSVTNIKWFLCSAGLIAKNFSVDLSNLNLSNVTNFEYILCYAGRFSYEWYVGDLGGWDTSNATSMNSLFSGSGYYVDTWSAGNIKNWDTSKVKDMQGMFSDVGAYAKKIILDLSTWDTSSLTDIYQMFYGCGGSSNTMQKFYLDISGWNTSKITGVGYAFYVTASRAQEWTIIIPKTNSNGLTNTTTKMYGKTNAATPYNDHVFTISSQ